MNSDDEPSPPVKAGDFHQAEESTHDGDELMADEQPQPEVYTSHRQKITEILKNFLSPEERISSDASEEFISLLRGKFGGEVLREYIAWSPKCSELSDAWNLRRGTPRIACILSVIAEILGHPDGKLWSSGIKSILDRFAGSIIDSKLDDVYVELKSGESRRQSAALSLLASIVRRGMGLASEVTKNFDFKLPVLAKLVGVQKGRKERSGEKRSARLRRAFVRFAVSFIEVGNPKMLRWVLQQRDLYSGVLRKLGTDEEETVVYVLSMLRDKVLTEDNTISPGLRSVLFGIAVLEQLCYISGNSSLGLGAEIAHEVLIRACTDARNGLMPGPNLKGNEKRLLELMRKLNATESRYHRDLLLAIARRRLSLCSTYMDEFPYNLEPCPSSSWFAAISLVADLVSSIDADAAIKALATDFLAPPAVDCDELQMVLKCIIPRAFTRPVINKGLQHEDTLVKHGSLRLLLESVKFLGDLLSAIDNLIGRRSANKMVYDAGHGITGLRGLQGLDCFASVDGYLNASTSGIPPTEPEIRSWTTLKQYIQDEVRALLPNPQILLKLLVSSSYKTPKQLGVTLKRCAVMLESSPKKQKINAVSDDTDIVIGGIDVKLTDDVSSEVWENISDTITKQETDGEKDHTTTIVDIWDFDEDTRDANEPRDGEQFFHAKLLDVLMFYMRTMPAAFEGSFDFFSLLSSNPLSLSVDQQRSLFSLLVEYITQPLGNRSSARSPDLIYKHLQPLFKVLIYSQVKEIQDQAYVLARTAMISTGAFDQNVSEIDAWFCFLPGYNKSQHMPEIHGAEAFHDLSEIVIKFLCEAVSTVGNNLYKYLDHTRKLISKLDNAEDDSIGFSPLIICILQKCLRLLESDSGAFQLHGRSMISLYVCNTIGLILQTQLEMKLLPGLIHSVLFETLSNSSPTDQEPKSSLCEWRPLQDLMSFVQTILLDQNSCSLWDITKYITPASSSPFSSVIAKVKDFLDRSNGCGLVGVATAFTSSLICASPHDIITNFPSLLTVSRPQFQSHLSFLSSILFLERDFLVNVTNLWPELCFSALGMSEAIHSVEIPISADHLSPTESAAAAFNIFVRHVSFYTLFPATLTLGSCESARMLYTVHSNKILDLLRVKLHEASVDDLISYMRYVLFWTYQIMLSYIDRPTIVYEELFQMCFSLVEYIFDRLLVVSADTTYLKTEGTSFDTNYLQAIVDIIFHHPLVTLSLSNPLYCGEKHESRCLLDCLKAFRTYENQENQDFHSIRNCILQFLRKAFDCLMSLENGKEQVLMASRHLGEQSLLLLREEFDLCVAKKDLQPFLNRFCLVYPLMHFVSPFELLEVVLWMFVKVEDSMSVSEPGFLSAITVGVYAADGALDTIYSYLQQPDLRAESHLFWGRKDMNFDTATLHKVYNKIIDFATLFDLECADTCLFKAIRSVYNQSFARPIHALLPLYMLLSRIIVNSPIKILLHCLYPTSKIKAKTLLLLTELNPLYMSLFGHTFLNILKNRMDGSHVCGGWKLKGELGDDFMQGLSQDDFVLLLPSVLSYLEFNLHNCSKQELKLFQAIPIFYSRILLDGFSDWKSYVSRSIFEEEYHHSTPLSLNDMENLFSSSLIGKAVIMLRYFCILNGSSLSSVANEHVFNSIYPKSSADVLLDSDLKELDASSVRESLRLINQVVAKINFTMLLLVPPDIPEFLFTGGEEGFKEDTLEFDSNRLNCTKLSFLNILVNTLDLIVRKYPLDIDCCVKSCTADSFHAIRFLEYFILKNIVQLSMVIRIYLIQLPSIPFMTLFIRSSLLHRFGDAVTLKAIRCIFVTLSEGNFCFAEALQLVLAHSQFVSTILSNEPISGSFSFCFGGTLLQSMPSILKLLDTPTYQSVSEGKYIYDAASETGYSRHALRKRKLQLIKLLRVLYYIINQKQQSIGSVNDDGMNLKELRSLLLSGYGATLCEADLEMFLLIDEIKLIEGSDDDRIAGIDYLWGSSALKVRKEQALVRSETSYKITDSETIEKRNKMLFRENIPVDSKLCVMTVLKFCFIRSSRTDSLSLANLLQDNFIDTAEEEQPSDNEMVYDPAFILRFSIHSLSMGYLEPVEFSRLGLLAITFLSISSPDKGLRKLGYKALKIFKKILENYQNSKESMLLELLLTYLQNGITKRRQKIPSVTAIFAAEASFVLLESSREHFFTISKLLMHSPQVNLEEIPLFSKFFGSDSIHFKTDRLWILRLLYEGLNLDDDAEIYIKKELPEVLLNLCSSSLSDHDTLILTLQIVKKSVKFQKLAEHLVQHCGLIAWLSSAISFYGEKLEGDEKYFCLKVMDLSLKIISDVISSEMIADWLQNFALEQLSEFSSHLHSLFVGSLKLLKENIKLLKSMLDVMVSTLRISQKREIYKPHFSLSLEGLFWLYRAISVSNLDLNPSIELGFIAILVSIPLPIISQMDGAKLSKLLMWAISSALRSLSDQRSLYEVPDPVLPMSFKEGEESLISKLLRWAIASIILGSMSVRFSKATITFSSKRSKMETLQSLLEGLINETSEKGGNDCSANEALAVIILYLQQLLRKNCTALPSVVSALSILLLGGVSNITGKGYLNENRDSTTQLCSKIRCPAEANPAWRWCIDRPWEDRNLEQTETERMEEQHACQSLLIIFSNALGGESAGLPGLSHLDVERLGLFKWEAAVLAVSEVAKS